MNINKIQKRESRCYANVFGRLPVAIVKGKGMFLYDVEGKEYLDLFSGIAVNSVGHCHPEVVKAIKEQSEKLLHVSNWLYTLPQLSLAEKLEKLTGLEKAFLTNDGTEAVECAIKLARKSTGKKEIIAMKNAFHGRTFGSLSLTWGKKYRKPFEPLVPSMKFVNYNDIKAVRRGITKKTAAVIVEPIQGESGVIVPDDGYLEDLRMLTSKKGVLLIVDEIQTGFGRTGEMFAFQHEKIKPDIVCLAKALGGGLPIGATVFRGVDFDKGEHGGTMLGNPLTCAAANAAIRVIEKEKLVENSKRMGAYILNELKDRGFNARGRGLMIGIETKDGRETVLSLIRKGILTIYSENIVRVLPPLIIRKTHADKFLSKIGGIRQDGKQR